jgi:hypothetical protein
MMTTIEPTTWSRVALDKLIVAQFVQELPGPEDLLPCSQELLRGPCPQPGESIPHPSTRFHPD